MDLRTMMRELDEVIERARSVTEREAMLSSALPDGGLRRRKRQQIRIMRAHLHRLRSFRTMVRAKRRPGSRLS